MIKDIDYFIEQEKIFKQKHPDYGKCFYDENIGEMSFVGINDRLNFLSDGIISIYREKLKEYIGNEEQYNLSDAQRVMLRMLYCQHSRLFRDDYYEEIPEVVQNLFDTLDSVVAKAPLNTDKTLFRTCHEYDPIDFKIGETVTFPYSLTCTNYDWKRGRGENKYILTPHDNGKTRAHNLFEIYEHGDEKQVNFLRNTSFVVTNKVEDKNEEVVKIYFQEV